MVHDSLLFLSKAIPISSIQQIQLYHNEMGWFDDSRDAHQQVYGDDSQPNEAKFSHELIGGAAAFEGMKLFEDRQRREGGESRTDCGKY